MSAEIRIITAGEFDPESYEIPTIDMHDDYSYFVKWHSSPDLDAYAKCPDLPIVVRSR